MTTFSNGFCLKQYHTQNKYNNIQLRWTIFSLIFYFSVYSIGRYGTSWKQFHCLKTSDRISYNIYRAHRICIIKFRPISINKYKCVAVNSNNYFTGAAVLLYEHVSINILGHITYSAFIYCFRNSLATVPPSLIGKFKNLFACLKCLQTSFISLVSDKSIKFFGQCDAVDDEVNFFIDCKCKT